MNEFLFFYLKYVHMIWESHAHLHYKDNLSAAFLPDEEATKRGGSWGQMISIFCQPPTVNIDAKMDSAGSYQL